MAALDFHTVPTSSLHGPPAESPLDFFQDSPPPLNQQQPLGPCEVDDPLWAKMSTASVANKKRKKTDTKPQSQINKCLNEKRRREQENIYIEELAELISASFADMSSLSVKPDKCAILQETVTQIKKIKAQESSSGGSDAVQQGEVSSSRPNVLTNEVLGTLLLEALEGFLFAVNTEGKVEFVTENVSQFINYSVEEVLGKSIYNILHHGDHTRFSSSLLPMTPGWGDSSQPQPRNRTFNCRFLVKPPDEPHETMEQKQQRVSKYENMQISCTQVSYKFRGGGGGGGSDDEGGGDTGPCLMCVARRITPSEKHMGAPLEQFTMKLDTQGTIIDVDTSGASPAYSQYINKELKNRSLRELCHTGDLNKLTAHLKETLSSERSTSSIYRLKVGQDKYVHVQTKSKLFVASPHTPQDFIMATHSIIGDTEAADSLSGGSSVVSGDSGSIGDAVASSQMGSMGGPLLSSVNGAIGSSRVCSADLRPSSAGQTPPSTDLSNTITLSNSTTFTSVTLNSNEIGFEFDIFPSSTWDLVTEDRYVNSASPLYTSSQSAVGFEFDSQVLAPAGQDQPVVSEPSGSAVSVVEQSDTESAKLRDLLTKRPSSQDPTQDQAEIGKNRILKNLLKDDEEDIKPNISNQNQNNNMLLKLLNDKSDEDDDAEGRAGVKKHNELLHQLLKDEGNNQESHQVSDDPLFKGLAGTGGSPVAVGAERMGRKRPSSEEDEHGGKRGLLDHTLGGRDVVQQIQPQQQQQQQQGGSKLWEKNKMLASLLAKQPSTPTTIPPIPASVISATPQDKMPRLVRPPVTVATAAWSGGSVRPNPRLLSRPHSLSTSGSPSAPSPLNAQVLGSIQASQPWDQSDPILSDLLDQVIEIVPDAVTDNPALISMITAETPVTMGSTTTVSVPGYSQEMINEKMAINAIQKSLMQCESAVKSPIYSNSSVMSSQQQFPPPPLYQQQRQRFQVQGLQTQQVTRQSNQFIVNQQQQQALLQHRSKILQAQQLQAQQLQQKQRLLQQQQQQQLLIPSNATAAAPDPSLHNIGSLINDTVAPNVALQRSTSVESQLSPVGSYSGSTSLSSLSAASQISPSPRQQPYSPQPFSPVSYQQQQPQSQQPNAGSGGGGNQQVSQQSRLSPVSLNSYQQSQLSPRVSQGGFSGTQGNTWSQQQASRLSLQQQQNPMLNAQLAAGSSGFAGGGGPRGGGTSGSGGASATSGFLPSVRSLTSPGSRQSPFPPELSPTSATSYQFRLQRSLSSSPTTQLPGGFPGMGGMRYGPPMVYPHHPPDYQEYHHHHHHAVNTGANMSYPPPPPHNNHRPLPPHPTTGGGSNGVTEYVRQELRAMVGARTNVGPPRPPHQPPDLDDLAISFDMSPPVSESSKLWGNMGEMSASSPQQPAASPHTPRNTVEEVSRSDAKSSLLQKLLSE